MTHGGLMIISLNLGYSVFMEKTVMRTCWWTKQPFTWLNLSNSSGSSDWARRRVNGDAREPVTLQTGNTPRLRAGKCTLLNVLESAGGGGRSHCSCSSAPYSQGGDQSGPLSRVRLNNRFISADSRGPGARAGNGDVTFRFSVKKYTPRSRLMDKAAIERPICRIY